MKHIASCSFGKDSLATVLLALEHGEPLDEAVYCEVMFDEYTSGEVPEHRDFILDCAIPFLERNGVRVVTLRSPITFVQSFYRILKKGANAGKLNAWPLCGRCCIQRDCKLPPIRQYKRSLERDAVQYIGIASDEEERLARLDAAETLGITQYLDRKPKALSGGQRQRVAIGRAIVREPKVLLMDEPLSNLDAKLRNQMRTEIIKLRQQINTTFIYVTHDQVEAMTLGDRIVIMRDGYIQQIGTPQEVFNHPKNLFVAGFIGTPQMNFFPNATLAEVNGKYAVEILGQKIELTDEQNKALAAKGVKSKGVIAGVRPVHVTLNDAGIDGRATSSGSTTMATPTATVTSPTSGPIRPARVSRTSPATSLMTP